MKATLFILVITLSGISIGCSSVNKTASNSIDHQNNVVSNENDYYRNLADYLKRVPGVNVSGSGNNAYVTIRGVNSFNAGITPLYVIDGHAVGNSYSQANSMLNPQDIDFVRVLKGTDAAIYGVRGGNGVIEIATKKI